MWSGEGFARLRQILPLMLCLTVCPVAGAASDEVPNELNSPVQEPRILLPESAPKGTTHAVSARTVQTDDPLIKLVFETREAQRRRLLSTAVHTPWQIMHGLLALRQDFIISHQDRTVSGLDWVSSGPTFRDEHWFEKTQFGGRAHPYSVPYAFEGHINQFLAILSMSGLPLDHQFGTASGPITMRDMLTNAQRTVNEKEEITWTLWALSRYLPPDAQWKNSKGEAWSIERLVKLQVDKPLQGAPCGGTHGLFALAHARNVYLRTGQPLRGVWLEAEQKIRRYTYTARVQQNSDGTLSSNFFRGREYKEDFDKRMASAGHILEFLMIALPQEELSEPWVRRALEATCNDLMKNRHEYVSCSPLYHTVNGLTIYLERVAPSAAPGNLAVGDEPTRPASQSRAVQSPAGAPAAQAPAAGSAKAVVTAPAAVQAPAAAPTAPATATPPAAADAAAAAPSLAAPAAPAEIPVQLPLTVPADTPATQDATGDPAAAPAAGPAAPSTGATPAGATPAGATPAGATPAAATPAAAAAATVRPVEVATPLIQTPAAAHNGLRGSSPAATSEERTRPPVHSISTSAPTPTPKLLMISPTQVTNPAAAENPGSFDASATAQVPPLKPVPIGEDAGLSPAPLSPMPEALSPEPAGPKDEPAPTDKRKPAESSWKPTATERRRPLVISSGPGKK